MIIPQPWRNRDSSLVLGLTSTFCMTKILVPSLAILEQHWKAHLISTYPINEMKSIDNPNFSSPCNIYLIPWGIQKKNPVNHSLFPSTSGEICRGQVTGSLVLSRWDFSFYCSRSVDTNTASGVATAFYPVLQEYRAKQCDYQALPLPTNCLSFCWATMARAVLLAAKHVLPNQHQGPSSW